MSALHKSPIVPILLAGGTGTRLWPVSRGQMPKQFLPLVGQRSTYQQALARVSDPRLFAPPIVVTNEAFRFFAQEQAELLGIEPTIVLEPERRDSASAIAVGAIIAAETHPGAVALTLAADHVILDADLFLASVWTGRAAAEAGYIATFGIQPTAPKTSYGYIRCGKPLDIDSVYIVDAFVEKPDSATATRYIAEGYLWNSGNFLFRPDVLINELGTLAPTVAEAARNAVEKATYDLGFRRLDADAFAQAPRISIDYALMEKTSRAAVIEARFRWSDIGAWDGLLDVLACDPRGNATIGNVELLDAQGCVVHGGHGLTAVVGVENLVVVTTSDATLVTRRDRAEDVKGLVAALESDGHQQAFEHRRGYRPWGHYDSIDRGDRFQVKRIVVKPGGQLSLQKHLHRSEHWVVVCGTAEVTVDGAVSHLHENQSAYIPAGVVHRLANRGKIPLELIEVQTGSYLGEDDIVRLEDVYNRA